MNEELKPGALSSGFGQGINKRDEGPGFVMRPGLESFSIRRQPWLWKAKEYNIYLLKQSAM